MMKLSRPSTGSFGFFPGFPLFGIFLLLALTGCNSHAHTSDPHLRQIDQLLDSQLPQGTPKSRVVFFLSSQGFSLVNSGDPKTIIATVHRVNTDTLQPVTARVTFHFDPGDKLNTYELDAVNDSPPQP
jgi:hypothetical protein